VRVKLCLFLAWVMLALPAAGGVWQSRDQDFVIAVVGDFQAAVFCTADPTDRMGYNITMMQWIAARADYIDLVVITGDLIHNPPVDCYCYSITDEDNCTDYSSMVGACSSCNDAEAVACLYGTPGELCDISRSRYLVSIVEAAGLPWMVSTGNHELKTRTIDENGNPIALGAGYYYINQHFGVSDQSKNSKETSNFLFDRWSDGSIMDGYSLGTYHVVESAGTDWLAIAIPYAGNNEETNAYIDWIDQVVADHPGMPTIVAAHRFVHGTGWVTSGSFGLIDPGVNKHAQTFLNIGGHFSGFSDRQSQAHTKTADSGETIVGVLHDHSYGHGAQTGLPALITVNPVAGTVHGRLYSPNDTAWVQVENTDDCTAPGIPYACCLGLDSGCTGDGDNLVDWTYWLQMCGSDRFTLSAATCMPTGSRLGYLE
jgi:hypothetical protein